MILSQLLRDHMAARKLSVRALAGEIGMDHNNLWRIVRGENTRADNVVKILAWMCSTPTVSQVRNHD